MSDDSPKPERKPNPGWANLRPPIQKGEVRNPKGNNGRVRAEVVAAFLEESTETDPNVCKGRKVLEKTYAQALKGNVQAQKLLIEHWKGKPKQQLDLSSEDGSMSPMGPDTVGDAIRDAIERKKKEQSVQEAPADVDAGPK